LSSPRLELQKEAPADAAPSNAAIPQIMEPDLLYQYLTIEIKVNILTSKGGSNGENIR
jgi:hypothetical protein